MDLPPIQWTNDWNVYYIDGSKETVKAFSFSHLMFEVKRPLKEVQNITRIAKFEYV